MANNKIQTTALDFDDIKASLKEYLRGQQKFSDYDFEGSGLSLILDLLAYNTHYGALYTNLAINEAFLDSATKRDSVVSKAKELGYVPTSIRSAKTIVDIVLTGSSEDSLEIPKYTKFTTRVDTRPYTFYTTNSYVALKESGQFVFEDIELTEGTLLDFSFTADGINTSFSIPNAGIDLSTMVVNVQEEAEASPFDTFERSDTVMDVDGNSKVYFIKEVNGGRHQIEFGNGVVGKALIAGNIVTVTYMVSSGDMANTARTFQYQDTPPDNATAYVTTITPAFGGSQPESVEDIKWNAPRAFVAQNRCVTIEDFKTVVNSLYPNASSINVWGGEQNDPPTYGNVYISVKPEDAERLSEGEKSYLLNEIIKPRCTVTIHPFVVDPEYIYVDLDTAFYYAPTETNRTRGELASIVRTAIQNYNTSTLSKFGGILKGSVLGRVIDAADPCIKSSVSTFKLSGNVIPVYDKSTSYVVNFGNPIYKPDCSGESVLSTGFTILNLVPTVYFEDRPNEGSNIGTLRLYYLVQGKKEYVNNALAGSFGSVDYEKGIIRIDSLVITGIVGTDFKFTIKPQSSDVAAAHNKIVTIVDSLLDITPVVDQVADKYLFTSARN